jgi:hypothetical protein
MWNVQPHLMCRKHLLGEHLEMHMFLGALRKEKNIDGYIRNGLVEVHKIVIRHDQLMKEMERRGYNHNSPLVADISLPKIGEVNVNQNIVELKRRCADCRERIEDE